MKVGVIAVSVREGRIGEAIAKWTNEFVKSHGGFDEVEYIDLKEINLPVMNEPNHPRLQQYQHNHTRQWSQTIDSLDAVIFVTPEYDYFAPSSLVNAIDYLFKEWHYKPAGFVGYGGISGGLRSIQSAKPLVTTVKMMPIPESVSFHFAWDSIKEGKLQPTESHEKSAQQMLDELVRWTKALKPLRRNEN